jgi:hypothetical protein
MTGGIPFVPMGIREIGKLSNCSVSKILFQTNTICSAAVVGGTHYFPVTLHDVTHKYKGNCTVYLVTLNWLRHYATSQKVAGSRSDEVN